MVNNMCNEVKDNMAIPVKFYSVTSEEYEKIRQEMQEACHAQENQEEAERRKKDLEGGIFFVSGSET